MGTVTGPTSSTDTALARWNGTTGTVIQDSAVTLDGSGNFSGVAALNNGAAATTQTQGDNSTKIATTAYVDAGLSNLSLNNLTDVITDYSTGAMFLGQGSGASSSGNANTALGMDSLNSITSGQGNTAIGRNALFANNGQYNVGVGEAVMQTRTSGDYNVAVGMSGFFAQTTGSKNVGVGYNVGATSSSGSNNILIGYQADVPTASTSNYLNIGGAITGDLTTGPALMDGFTATTQPSGDNSAKIATTAYVDSASNTRVAKVKTQVFTTSGTYTPSTGMINATVECIAGGGAGGGVATSSSQGAGGGGGAGSYSRKLVTAVDIGASKAVTVGAGGTAGTAGNNPGNNGGDSSVGSLCVGKGGSGGAGAAANGRGNGGAGGNGGLTAVGDVTGQGERGLIGLAVSGGMSGAGGNSGVYGAGGGPRTSAGAGNDGRGYGSGGGGGYDIASGGNQTGGLGMPGIVIITEYCSQ